MNAEASRVQGKVVLVTGGAKRVGAAICRRLHAAGAIVMLHYRASAGEARLLQAELNHTRPDSVALIQADLLDLGKLASIIEQTVQTFGRLDALVNNASSFFQTPVGEIQAADWEDLVGTNVRAPLFLSQAAAPALRASHGAIVNITDIHAERPLKNYLVYSVAKAGMIGLTKALAKEVASRNVSVNALALGLVATDMSQALDEAYRQKLLEQIPMRRFAETDEIARVACFLLSDEARYITGQVIQADGGLAM